MTNTTPHKTHSGLYALYPPSELCDCDTCRYFCLRPGWWLVAEAREAIAAGLSHRMMMEMAPDRSFAVLSPAFAGNEGFYALREYSSNGCTFLQKGRCSIVGASYRPLECRFSHHTRIALGPRCHADIGRDWNSHKGQRLVRFWASTMHLFIPPDPATPSTVPRARRPSAAIRP